MANPTKTLFGTPEKWEVGGLANCRRELMQREPGRLLNLSSSSGLTNEGAFREMYAFYSDDLYTCHRLLSTSLVRALSSNIFGKSTVAKLNLDGVKIQPRIFSTQYINYTKCY